MKDLTNSVVDRKNILNNDVAIKEIYDQIGFHGVMFDSKYRYTKGQLAYFFEVDVRTIERLLENNNDELVESGYELFTGRRLRELREAFVTSKSNFQSDVPGINVGDIQELINNQSISSKAASIGIFTFKAFLNIGMLLTNSERAKDVRQAILNIVIDVLNKKLGGSTKYINQREEEFLPSAIREYNYRQAFTNALDHYIHENKFKYAQLTDKIYKSIFKENAKEYRQILNLNSKGNAHFTMYSEVLNIIVSYESGFADFLKKEYEKTNQKLRLSEAHIVFKIFEELMDETLEPLREKARGLMASRDMTFRDALDEKLKDYVSNVSTDDFNKFLGEKSKSLEERIEENRDVFIRLKER
ncbi:DNA-binding protein [Chitinophaga sancti]|uniref:DNA-binding protein n=1 Tax=Chitinophaga sancti TaxID=1004 RepID=A0A1K1P0C3_9BACT|nr:DNA-binding protein [Chitinophaga sancti]WQD60362.1 DNA-binding protein [Chitinophaga sancti]WQG87510.1 DNA-binding protein [Chitinophaga sancti]SFW41023.1 hypothetical protein SAMN05661012_01665 [Chitinophaga sancti]